MFLSEFVPPKIMFSFESISITSVSATTGEKSNKTGKYVGKHASEDSTD